MNPMQNSIIARGGVRTGIACAVLFLGTLFLFSRATSFEFLNYDDPAYVVDNPQVRGGLSWSGVVWAFTAPADYWHPLTWLSHMLDWQLYGDAAWGHHLTSVLFHALNAALAFLVFRRLSGEFWLSAFAAAVFAWHPLRVESVLWIAERKDVLSGCFFLLSILAYTRFVERRRNGKLWWRSYALTGACFILGLMSKPMLVTLPALMLVLDAWPLRRIASRRDLWPLVVEKIPFFALSLVTAVVTVLMQKHEGAFVLDLPLGARIANAVVSVARYLGKFFWPFDLIVCYPHPGYWRWSVVLGSAALVFAMSALAWWQRRKHPWIAAGWLWFLVGLLPVIGLLQVGIQAMADRYTYLPMLGIELALFRGVASRCTTPRARLAPSGVAVALLAALGLRTWNQESVWRDSVALFEHAVQSTDGADSLPERFLASALFAKNRIDEAEAHAQRAIALDPRSDGALATLAGVRERQGRIPEAIALYRAALGIGPDAALLRMQMGLLELSLGHAATAQREMTAALRAKPALRYRTLELAHIASEHRDLLSAHFYYSLVLAVMPDDVEAHVGLGAVYIGSGDRARGLAEWRRALELAPGYPGLREHFDAEAARP